MLLLWSIGYGKIQSCNHAFIQIKFDVLETEYHNTQLM